MTVRHDTRLADGRELFYFDRLPGREHGAPDLRTGLAATATTRLRWDPLTREYAVLADHRQERTYRPPAEFCPLCPHAREGRRTEIPDAGYEVAVLENRFPSFTSATAGLPVDDPLFASAPGTGRCEVISFTSEHETSFAQLDSAQARTVLDAWIDRTSALARLDAVDYVLCFENRGAEIGVTLSHPHGQIYGYPFVPPRFVRTGEAYREHAGRAGTCLQCDLLAAELGADTRIVLTSAHWVGYVPLRRALAFEVRLVPRRHLPDLATTTEPERDDLVASYLAVLRGFDRLFDTPAPYIAAWQQAPVRRDRDVWHLAAEIFTIRRAPDRLKYLAASESAAGVWINDVAPEQAAARLRSAIG